MLKGRKIVLSSSSNEYLFYVECSELADLKIIGHLRWPLWPRVAAPPKSRSYQLAIRQLVFSVCLSFCMYVWHDAFP